MFQETFGYVCAAVRNEGASEYGEWNAGGDEVCNHGDVYPAVDRPSLSFHVSCSVEVDSPVRVLGFAICVSEVS